MPLVPPELYYAICSHVRSNEDLLLLALSSSILKQPAESELHRTVHLDTHERILAFASALRDLPRLRTYVREVKVEKLLRKLESSGGNTAGVGNLWSTLKEILSKLANLEILVINDGADELLAQTLFEGLEITRLRILRCSFVLDDRLLKFIAGQDRLEELAWTGSLIFLPQLSPLIIIDEQHSTQPNHSFIEHGNGELNADPDIHLLLAMRKYFPPGSLPLLRTLRTECLALARVLVPGRPVEHLWVPGAGGAAYDCFFARRTRSAQIDQQNSTELELIPAHSVLSSPILTANRLIFALGDFSRSTFVNAGSYHGGGIQALRISLDLPPPELNMVYETISRTLPGLKTLGFVNACSWEIPRQHAISNTEVEKGENNANRNINMMNSNLAPLCLPYLHTIFTWSTPSRRVLSELEILRNQPDSPLPKLECLACLHFSSAFEWLYLPVLSQDERLACDMKKEKDNLTAVKLKNPVCWEREDGIENGRRKVTAVHDLEHLLWRTV